MPVVETVEESGAVWVTDIALAKGNLTCLPPSSLNFVEYPHC